MTSKCSQCPHRLKLLLTGDCLQISTQLFVQENNNYYTLTAADRTLLACIQAEGGPNQICKVSCSQYPQVVEIATRKFFKLEEIYWRRRYLMEHMDWPYELLHS